MDHSRPVGSLGGGGWEQTPLHESSSSSQKKSEKVLTDMYEMFLDSVDPEIIHSVVQSCGFNYQNSMDALLEMCRENAKSIAAALPIQSSLPQPTRNTAILKTRTPSSTIRGQEENKLQSLMSLSVSSPSLEEKKLSILPALQSSSEALKGLSRKSAKHLTPILSHSLSSELCAFETKKQNVVPVRKESKIRWYIENCKRLMIIMRGCPGSGKSHFATDLVVSYGGKPKDFVFSTDDYFLTKNGFNYVPGSVSKAHEWNQKRVLKKLREGWSPIIIDNTNTQLWEMTVYASSAINNGYDLEIVEPQTSWFNNLGELTKRNKHGVPRDKIKRMLERYERHITVDSLIRATGAQYKMPPPQTAEHSLCTLNFFRDQNQDVLRTSNHTAGVARKDQMHMKSVNFSPNFSYSFNNQAELNEIFKRSPHSPHALPTFDVGNYIHFGPQASYPSTTNNMGTNHTSECDTVENTITQSLDGLNLHNNNRSDECSDEGINNSLLKTIPNSFWESGVNSFEIPSRESESGAETKSDRETIVTLEEFQEAEHCAAETKETYKSSRDGVHFISEGFTSTCTIPTAHESTEIQKGCASRDANEEDTNQDLVAFPPENIVNETSADHSDSNFVSDIMIESTNVHKSSESSHTVSEETKINLTDQIIVAGCSDWNDCKVSKRKETVLQKPLPKLPDSLSTESILDYCQSVRDINITSQNKACAWSPCENASTSWQPIEKIQDEIFQKEKYLSHSDTSDTSQRLRFKPCSISEKSTNTHHSDFCILSKISTNSDNGTVFLNANDRDINEGRTLPSSKVPLKLMLDKGTSTENDFDLEVKTESKQEKIKGLLHLFPNRSRASIKELLKQCNWDVNYVSNLLLDTSNENLAIDGIPDEDSEEEFESFSKDQEGVKDVSEVANDPTSSLSLENSKTFDNCEEAREVKKHLEQSIDFSETHYSPKILAIKNFRRCQQEGAIPKTSVIPTSESEAEEIQVPLNQSVDLPVEKHHERSHTTSESSEETEDSETLEFIVGHDFMQQLVDKFGGSLNVANLSPVVKFPVSLAQKIYDVIFVGNNFEEEDDDVDYAMKLQCEEDEKLARQLYEEMMQKNCQPGSAQSSEPCLREIIDMELAQAIYRANVESLTKNSPESMAQVLAKRLLEDNYKQVDKKILHDIYSSCNNSFEDTIKTLQEALSTGDNVIRGTPKDQEIDKAEQDNNQINPIDIKECSKQGYQSVEEDIEVENPWESSDPNAYYSKCREEADNYSRKRDEMYQKARDAFTRKQRSAAAYYAKLGEINGKKYHHANALAAAALAAAHCESHSDETLDLHHFRVVEAVNIFDLYVDYHIKNLPAHDSQQKCLYVITGKGTHSRNGKPRIKPAILSRIKKRSLRVQHIINNLGVIKVWVTANSILTHQIPS